VPEDFSSAASRTALVAGATGLVGASLVQRLVGTREFARIVALVRRPLGPDFAGVDARVVDFGNLDAFPALGATDAFCALGTTRAAAGSPDAFRRVDFDHAFAFARAARRDVVRRFVLVSSIGADSASTNLYLRTKGELEDAVGSLAFESLTILRPGLLLGERREPRPAESVARAFAPVLALFLHGRFRRYRPVPAAIVAAAMVSAALEAASGRRIVPFDDILDLARRAGLPSM
jgi:uncharacterized protein YbjT (DUF2867 family)